MIRSGLEISTSALETSYALRSTAHRLIFFLYFRVIHFSRYNSEWLYVVVKLVNATEFSVDRLKTEWIEN